MKHHSQVSSPLKLLARCAINVSALHGYFMCTWKVDTLLRIRKVSLFLFYVVVWYSKLLQLIEICEGRFLVVHVSRITGDTSLLSWPLVSRLFLRAYRIWHAKSLYVHKSRGGVSFYLHFMQLFSANATIFKKIKVFCPWKHEKTPSKVACNS